MTIVALHGAYGAPEDWQAVWEALPSTTTFDERRTPWLPGHHAPGRAQPDLAPSAERWELALLSLERQLEGLPRIELIGYSMGARLALALALRPALAPRLRGLVLVAGTAGIDGERGAELRAARATLDDARAAALLTAPAAMLRSFWQLPLFEQLRDHPSYAALLTARIARIGHRPCNLAAWTAGLSVGRQPPLWDALAPLRAIPVGLVAGTRDDAYVAHARRFAAQLPHARISWAEGCGHALLVEAPQIVARALVEVCS